MSPVSPAVFVSAGAAVVVVVVVDAAALLVVAVDVVVSVGSAVFVDVSAWSAEMPASPVSSFASASAEGEKKEDVAAASGPSLSARSGVEGVAQAAKVET